MLFVQLACACVGLPRSTYYRLKRPSSGIRPRVSRRPHPRALSVAERQEVLELLQSDRFISESPAEIYATILDEGRYLCSVSTMYRLLKAEQKVQERRQASRNAKFAKPELKATAPNQIWSWDISKLLRPEKWGYYYFYAIIDIFSRLIVGWTVSEHESAKEADSLLSRTCWEQSIAPGQLVIHSDRGSPMKSKTVGEMLIDFGVAKSLSRPHVSNDNPYSETNFKTLKSRPTYPATFQSLEHAKSYLHEFVDWFNCRHKHGGIAHMTPATVHYGKADDCINSRQRVLDKVYEAHPGRFVKGAPRVSRLPTFVGINIPKDTDISSPILSVTLLGAVTAGAL